MVTTAMPWSRFRSFQLSTSRAGLPFSCLAPATTTTRSSSGTAGRTPRRCERGPEGTRWRRWGGARIRAIRGPGKCGRQTARGSMLRLACPAWEIRWWSACRAFGTTIFAEMSALAATHRRDQPRAGLPRHRRTAADAGGRRARHRVGAQPVPAGARDARAADRDRGAPAAVLRARGGPGPRGAGDGGRHRGHRRGGPRAVRAGRRGGDASSRTTTPTPPRSPWPARYGGPRCCASPTSRSTRRRCGRRSPPRTRLVLLNTPHNPTGKVFSRAELELVCALAREHDAWVVTDEVYEHLVFDGAEHVPVATLPGMAIAHPHHLLGRQDLLGDGVEGRLGARPRGRGGGRADGQAVPHLRGQRAVPAGGGRGAGAGGLPCTPGWRRRCRPSATCCARACAPAGCR